MATDSFHPFRSEQAREEFLSFYLQKSKRWPIPSETRLIDTASGATFVRISGKASDPPLVLLPGARGSSLMWIPNIAALSALASAGPDREAVEQDIFEMVMSGRFFAKPRMMWPTVFDDEEWRAFAVPALFLVGENEIDLFPEKGGSTPAARGSPGPDRDHSRRGPRPDHGEGRSRGRADPGVPGRVAQARAARSRTRTRRRLIRGLTPMKRRAARRHGRSSLCKRAE
jgi:hypothetical protein